MTHPRTDISRIDDFFERERRQGRHWRPFRAINEFYYAGPAIITGHPRNHYPLLHLVYSFNSIPESLIYLTGPGPGPVPVPRVVPSLVPYLDPYLDPNFIFDIPLNHSMYVPLYRNSFWFELYIDQLPRDMQNATRAVMEFWFR
ncbi:hypothetical protein [Xenorhabdus bovienii]|uniref:hypothetical protein n=1 Tax=Xenorhabdus bovienii TaxID=40576 RepID=UPI003DA57B57